MDGPVIVTETDIQKEILEYLQTTGIFAWRNNTGRKGKVSFGLPGSSDIIGILPDGRFLAVEVKGPKTKVQKNQKEFLSGIKHRGGVAFVARSIEDVVEELEKQL